MKIINQMRTHNKVISDTYEQEAAIIKEQELLQARDTEIFLLYGAAELTSSW